MSAPKLIGAAGNDNLIEWAGKVWRVPQALGPLDIDNEAHRDRPGITSHDNLVIALAAARPPQPASPGGIRCTWWQRTGAMTEFVDGISSPVFRNMETGEELSSRELPVGALYAIKREPDDAWPPVGSDGLSIACVLPGRHHWYIDGRAANCTMPADAVHRCWVRHGTVGERIRVDKDGNTCQAGGGSIQTDKWHGNLHDGELRPC